MRNKKKKYMIIAAAVVVCAVIFIFAIKAQSVYNSTISNKQMSAENEQNKSGNTSQTGKSPNGINKNGEESSDASGKSTETSSSINSNGVSKENGKTGQASTNQKGASKSSGTSGTDSQNPEAESSIEIIDAVHGNAVILRENLNGIDGQTVGYVTQKALDGAKISYTAKGSGSTVYFSDINGLKEKAEGPLSGWCYYVRKKGESQFVKATTGSGQYVLNSGDAVIWKYVKDGYSN
ncbi:DUF4430 domain-containing protein [Clostridium luticellarii]|jgi:hypothetical protein|uniref:DUF4430 domain-containing protein n=1 Tax=Clostridium luticellarii TaxID=1691940 RepID=UPI002357694A|nr:DUF4430 domain-containing protein [Clostridium luticellarii]MCI1944551.1 DUF4430 domain-containing protein [Clostridium luticellarii]MCI1968050.1 DUF4430 domain-containing protein [Clostridium luticellarii]MCI1995558.1 DUF4430 domain-containing protein [Clostridium luticellarii]MCI2039892.1 DUF4430 domain-containing protein [Clostridium luticellarii]